MRPCAAYFVFVILGHLLAGCATPTVWPRQNSLLDSPPLQMEGRYGPYKFDGREERGWYKKAATSDGSPNFCVAMSGGGLRSATYNIGVLRGLAQERLLQEVDIMSAVSGGSYAAASFLAQHYWLVQEKGFGPHNLSDVFGSRFLEHLQERAAFYRATDAPGLFYSSFGLMLSNLYHNGIFGRHANTVGMAENYRRQIQNAFLDNPYRPANPVVNRKPSVTQPVPDLEMPLVANHSRDHKLPFLIINGTAQFTEGAPPEGLTLEQSTFEFTPIAYGSDGLGRYPYCRSNQSLKYTPEGFVRTECKTTQRADFIDHDEPFGVNYSRTPSLSVAVATSGAAVDFTQVTRTSVGRKVASILNLDLGVFFQNPLVSGDERARYNTLVVPFYWFSSRNGFDVNGVSFYVTDGGHSENLGAAGLIRRGCRNILIVDAEHDPHYTFGAYKILKEELNPEDPARDAARLIVKSERIDRLLDEDRVSNEDSAKKRGAQRSDDWGLDPIAEGTIVRRGGREEDVIRFVYLKLAKAEIAPDSCEKSCTGGCDEESEWIVRAEVSKDDEDRYYCSVRQRRGPLIGGGTFPQQETADLTYRPMQVRAYVHLGARSLGDSAKKVRKYLRQ